MPRNFLGLKLRPGGRTARSGRCLFLDASALRESCLNSLGRYLLEEVAMNRLFRLFMILALLGFMAVSCHNSPDPAVPEHKSDVASADNPAEPDDEDVQEYIGEGTTPDEQLMRPIMQFRELDRVEAEFGKPEWADAKLFTYEDFQFVMVPIVSIRQNEFHCLVAAPVEDDLLIFIMSAETGPIPLGNDATQIDPDDVLSLDGSMTFVHGPDLGELLFVKIDDSSVDRVSSLSSKAKCVWKCFKRYPLKGIAKCVSLAKACLSTPFPLNIPICYAAAVCIYKYYRNTVGPLIKCILDCFGWHSHALKPTKS
jgi:hypothetical protein